MSGPPVYVEMQGGVWKRTANRYRRFLKALARGPSRSHFHDRATVERLMGELDLSRTRVERALDNLVAQGLVVALTTPPKEPADGAV